LREKQATARAQLDAAQERLARQRTAVGDEELALRAQTDAAASDRAAARVADVRSRLTEITPERISSELGDAQRHADELTRNHDAVAGGIRGAGTQIRGGGEGGREGRTGVAGDGGGNA